MYVGNVFFINVLFFLSVDSIEVCDDIPVTVFGQPIPELHKK